MLGECLGKTVHGVGQIYHRGDVLMEWIGQGA